MLEIKFKDKNDDKKDSEYPFIGIAIYDRCVTIVLFYSKGAGTVLRSDNKTYKIGQYFESFGMNHFERFDGEIVLKNA